MTQQSISVMHRSAVTSATQAAAHRNRVEWGRKAILLGAVTALAGVITYCYASMGGDYDICGTLFESGVAGWASCVLMLTGVGIWMAGTVVLLDEAEYASESQR